MANRKKNLFCCNGNLYEAFVDEKSAIKLNVYNVSRQLSSLTLSDKCVLDTNFIDLSIETVGTFADPYSGIFKPYIFVYNELSNTYFLYVREKFSKSKTSKLSAVCQLQGNKEESWIPKSLKVLDGKLLVWQCKRCIYVGYTNSSRDTTFERQSFLVGIDEPSQFSDFSIDLVSAVTDESDIVIFIRYTFNTDHSDGQDFLPSQNTKLIVWLLKKNVDGNWIKTELDSSNFLPKEYASTILDCKVMIQRVNSRKSSTYSEQISSTVVLLLEGSYVVELKNGSLSRCCFIDDCIVTDPKEWKIIDVFDGTRAVMRTSDSDVIVVDTEKAKIIQKWSDVSNCVIGDFLQHGCPQLLIIFLDDLQDEINSWLLTDFAGCQIDSRNVTDQETESTDHGKNKSIASAVEALYNNLQSSSANLCEAEQHLSNKTKFLHNTWQQLQQSSKGREATLFKPEVPLVTLLDNLPKEKSARSNVKDHINKVQDLVSKVSWKTTVGSHLIIGVEVHNQTDKVFTQGALSLVPHSKVPDSEIKSFSKWLPCPSSKQMAVNVDLDHSSAKRLKLDSDMILPASKQKGVSLKPMDKLTLSVSTDLAGAGFQDCFKVWVFLSVKESLSTVSGSGDSLMNVWTSEMCIVCCGLVSITTQEILHGAFSISPDFASSSGQDPQVVEASLSTIQMSTRLEMASTFTNLTQVQRMLQSQTGFQLVPSLDCLGHATCPLLHYVRIQRPDVISTNLAHVSVWTRDLNQLILLVQHLYSCLPDDIKISHQTMAEKGNSLSAALSHLTEEIKTVSMATRTLLDGSSQCVKAVLGAGDSLSESKHPDQVDELRRHFGEQQTSVQKLEVEQTDPYKVKVMKDVIRHTQRRTDESVALLTCDDP